MLLGIVESDVVVGLVDFRLLCFRFIYAGTTLGKLIQEVKYGLLRIDGAVWSLHIRKLSFRSITWILLR